jgi:peptidoglycan-N-acetylglucosamine deacetylase
MRTYVMRGLAVAAVRLVTRGALLCLALLITASAGFAQQCPKNPQAVGTSRVIAVDPAVLPQVGKTQYPRTLPLRDHEVVLTFDDGPVSPWTGQVLDGLAAQCVQANFFIVGEGAKAKPELVRRAHDEGHTIGTHTFSHADLAKLRLDEAIGQIQDGFDAVNAALGPENTAAPFFRAPYLSTTPELEAYLSQRGIMLWGIDVDPEDWRPSSPQDVVNHIFEHLEPMHSGIILMHDVQPHTATALPILLAELKARGYSVAHVIYGKGVEAAAHQ